MSAALSAETLAQNLAEQETLPRRNGGVDQMPKIHDCDENHFWWSLGKHNSVILFMLSTAGVKPSCLLIILSQQLF